MSSWSKKYVVIITDKYWGCCNHKFLLIKNKPEPDTSSDYLLGISYDTYINCLQVIQNDNQGEEYTEQSSQ